MKRILFLSIGLILGLGAMAQKDSVQVEYWESSGKKKMENHFRDGKKHGVCQRWYEDGQPMLKEEFEMGKIKAGTAYYRTPPGRILKLYEREYTDGINNYKMKEWHPNGQYKGVVEVVDGYRHGEENYFALDGKEYTKRYEHGELIEGMDVIRYKSDTKNYLYKRRYENKLVVEVHWEDYYPSDKKRKEEVYIDGSGGRDGTPHGTWVEWFENGNKMSEMIYEKGLPTGTWTWWYENGKKKSELRYENGSYVDGSMKEWDESGKEK